MSTLPPAQPQSGSTTPKRDPKVGVYIPRHRRVGANEGPGGADRGGLSSEQRDKPSSGTSTLRSTPSATDDTFRSWSSSRPSTPSALTGNNDDSKRGGGQRVVSPSESAASVSSTTSSASEVSRRGRGKFMGPGGGSSSSINSGSGGGSNRNEQGQTSRSNSYSSTKTVNSSSNKDSSSYQPPGSIHSSSTASANHNHSNHSSSGDRPSRGRDFDATVLRVYDDRPSSFSSGDRRSNTKFYGGSAFAVNQTNTVYSSCSSNMISNSTGNSNSGNSGNSGGRGSNPNSGTSSPNNGRVYSSGPTPMTRQGSNPSRSPKPTSLSATNPSSSPTSTHMSRGLSASSLTSSLNKLSLGEPPSPWSSSPVSASPTRASSITSATSSTPKLHRSGSSTPAGKESSGNASEVEEWELAGDDIESDDGSANTHATSKSNSARNNPLTVPAPVPSTATGFAAPLDWVETNNRSGSLGTSSSNSNVPSARPQKQDFVAKRLVQGALGIRVRRTPEQIAEEKALVASAKEARDLQRKERELQKLEEQTRHKEIDAVFDS